MATRNIKKSLFAFCHEVIFLTQGMNSFRFHICSCIFHGKGWILTEKIQGWFLLPLLKYRILYQYRKHTTYINTFWASDARHRKYESINNTEWQNHFLVCFCEINILYFWIRSDPSAKSVGLICKYCDIPTSNTNIEWLQPKI